MAGIERVLKVLDGVKRCGDGWMAFCPAHDDHKKSFSVRKGGDGKPLVKCFGGCSQEAVIQALRARGGWPESGRNGAHNITRAAQPPNPVPASQVEACHRALAVITRNYLWKKRAISSEVIDRYRVGFVEFKGEKRITIPVPDERGQFVDVRMWLPPECRAETSVKILPWRREKCRGSHLFPLDQLTAGRLLLCEGEPDALAAISAGIATITTTAGASVCREEWVGGFRGKEVITLFDHDRAGIKGSKVWAEKVAQEGCKIRIAQWPSDRPEGWDITDELVTYGVESLKGILDQARVYQAPIQLGRLCFTSLGELLDEPEEATEWLVEERLPVAGLSILAGKPKAGKSTLARNLCLSVARGEAWLGQSTAKGTILYLALEEKRSQVRAHFRKMGATGEDGVFVLVGASPEDGLKQLREAAHERKPALIIVDPLFRFVRVPDSNDYARVTAALEPLMTLARETGAHLLTVHHLGKGAREGGDAILGSTAIYAAVDTALILKRTEKYRTLHSIQRYGTDLEEVVLEMDETTGVVRVAGSRQEADEQLAGDAILEFLKTQDEPVEEKLILEEVSGRRTLKVRALRQLVEQNRVLRMGAGKRGDTYHYSVSCSLL